jgi:hypothetical protein
MPGRRRSAGVALYDDESHGQGPDWVVFVLWFVLPLLLLFIGLTFTG